MYQELNRRITTNGVTLPNIADNYELERIFTEEECAYVLGGKKAVLLLDHVSALLNHPIEKISEHFQEVMNRLKIISTREKYYFQCFIGLDTVSKEEAVMNHFDEQLEEDQHNLPDPFYRMTFNR